MTYADDRLWRDQDLELAKVLLVDSAPATRLTLQAVLQASGYQVDVATSASEALSLMDSSQYALVMTDLPPGAPEGGLEVLAHARLMDYQPATAILTSHASALPEGVQVPPTLVEPEDLPGLLTTMADLISQRAARLVHDELRVAG